MGRETRKRAGLQVVQQTRKRRPLGKRTPVPTRALDPNHVWSDDFVHDETTDGQRLPWLTVLEEYTRKGQLLDWARSIPAADVVHVLQRLVAQRSTPPYVKSDLGPEFMAQQVTAWRPAHYVVPDFIAPGSPWWQNGYHESFHGVFREGCLNRWLLAAVQEARRIINNWREE